MALLGITAPWIIGETLYNDPPNGSGFTSGVQQPIQSTACNVSQSCYQRIYTLDQWWTKRAGNTCPNYPDPDQDPPAVASNYLSTLGEVALPTYLVGDIYPDPNYYAPYFGDGHVNLNDVDLLLMVQTGAPG